MGLLPLRLKPDLTTETTQNACFGGRLTRLAQVATTSGMIRKLKSGQFRLYSRKKSAETGKRRNLGTFSTLDQARQHEREVQYFKKH